MPFSGGMQSSDIASARRVNLSGTSGTPALRTLVRQGFKNFGVATYPRPDGGDGSGGDGYSTAPPRIGVIDHTFYHSTATLSTVCRLSESSKRRRPMRTSWIRLTRWT